MDGRRTMSEERRERFRAHLAAEEKSEATIGKYLRDVRAFSAFADGREVTKELVRSWKEALLENGYAPRSINSMLASLNSLLALLGWEDCRVKSLRTQRRTYRPEEKELTKAEYLRLLEAAKGQPQLRLVMETICATGIRVSELRHFTVGAVRSGQVDISCKGKIRTVLIPGKLRKRLLSYAGKAGVQSGAIFLNREGRPLGRGSVWARMKRLCAAAGVAPGKVFPHNLRRLFARAFYRAGRDVAGLADVLGHSSIDTTRLYLMTSGAEHRRRLDRLGLVV